MSDHSSSAVDAMQMKGHKRRAAFLLLALWSAAALAAEENPCRVLKDERDQLSAKAMTAEIALARTYREQICPALARQAEQANANQRPSGEIDYEALIDCRQKAETRLEKSNQVLYRNRLGFTFYTQAGTSLAQQADQKSQELESKGCP